MQRCQLYEKANKLEPPPLGETAIVAISAQPILTKLKHLWQDSLEARSEQ